MGTVEEMDNNLHHRQVVDAVCMRIFCDSVQKIQKILNT